MSNIPSDMSIEGPVVMPLTPVSLTVVNNPSPPPLMLPPSERGISLSPSDSVSNYPGPINPNDPLSPRTSLNLLEGTRLHLAKAIQIGQGLCETIRRREEAHRVEREAHEE
jgi:hypothetical protein